MQLFRRRERKRDQLAVRSVVGHRLRSRLACCQRYLCDVASVEGVYNTWRLCRLKSIWLKREKQVDDNQIMRTDAGAARTWPRGLVGTILALPMKLRQVREGSLRQRRRGVVRA
jgi:hypothetical protein